MNTCFIARWTWAAQDASHLRSLFRLWKSFWLYARANVCGRVGSIYWRIPTALRRWRNWWFEITVQKHNVDSIAARRRRICSDANREVYIGSLFDVAMDLWKSTIIQDNQQFTDLCWVIIEVVMGYHTFSEELLLILTATFVNIASFFNKTSFELTEGVNFPVSYLHFFNM